MFLFISQLAVNKRTSSLFTTQHYIIKIFANLLVKIGMYYFQTWFFFLTQWSPFYMVTISIAAFLLWEWENLCCELFNLHFFVVENHPQQLSENLFNSMEAAVGSWCYWGSKNVPRDWSSKETGLSEVLGIELQQDIFLWVFWICGRKTFNVLPSQNI